MALLQTRSIGANFMDHMWKPEPGRTGAEPRAWQPFCCLAYCSLSLTMADPRFSGSTFHLRLFGCSCVLCSATLCHAKSTSHKSIQIYHFYKVAEHLLVFNIANVQCCVQSKHCTSAWRYLLQEMKAHLIFRAASLAVRKIYAVGNTASKSRFKCD